MDLFINLETAFMADPITVVAAHCRLAAMRSRTAVEVFCRTALRVCFSAYVINTNAAGNRISYSATTIKREGPAGSRSRLHGRSGAAPSA